MVVNNLRVSFGFYHVAQDKQELIKQLVQKNIDGKMDTYLQKVVTHKPDAEIHIDYKVQKNKQDRYEAKFLFVYDGKVFQYSNKTAFKYVEDLVNHAFTHFKEQLSK